ncbi:hypothetical protein ACS0TY_036774 [Phlomoides rotata]
MFGVLQKANRFFHTVSFYSGLIDHCFSLTNPSNYLKAIHAQLLKGGIISNTYLGNRCIDLYLKSGSSIDALKAFYEIPSKNIVSWNLYLKVLVKCFDMETAGGVFDEMPERDAVSWNTIVSGYISSGFLDSAWEVFLEMRDCGVRPSGYTFSMLLCCVNCGNHAKEMHGFIFRNGGYYSNLVIGNSLIDVYGKLGLVDYSLAVFLSMKKVDVISWNSIIFSCCNSGYEKMALNKFCLMRNSAFEFDEYTVSSAISACSNLRNLGKGLQIFCLSIKMGFLWNTVVSSAAINLFSKCNRAENAIRLFEESYVFDSAICNSMIACYASHSFWEKALELFIFSLRENIRPTEFTLSSVLHSAVAFVPVEQGRQLHSLVIKTGFEFDVVVASSLVHMYSKYGFVDSALKVFVNMDYRDLIVWNTMILALTENGKLVEAIGLFKELLQSRLNPDRITFSGVLLACSYGELLEEGVTIFSSMQKHHGVDPVNEHYTYIMDMLIRAGRIDEAVDLLRTLQREPHALIWKSLLHACGDYENLELIESVAEKLMELEPYSSLHYFNFLAKTYERRCRWESLVRVRRKMEKVAKKEVVDCSWIGIRVFGGKLCYFDMAILVWPNEHPEIKNLNYAKRITVLEENSLSFLIIVNMAFIQRSNSSRRRTTPLIQGGVVIAYDAIKNHNFEEFNDIISDVLRHDMVQEGSTIMLLGVLDRVLHPMGFQIKISPKSFIGAHVRAIEEEVSRKVDTCVRMLKRSAIECEGKGVDITVKIAVGVPMKNVLVEEIIAMQSTWAILYRQSRKKLGFYIKHIPCKIAHVCDNLSLEVLRPNYIDLSIDTMKYKLLHSLSKPVPLPPSQIDESDTDSAASLCVSPLRSSVIPSNTTVLMFLSPCNEHGESGLNPQQKVSGDQNELGNKCDGSPQERDQQNNSEVAVHSTAGTTKARGDAVGPGYSEIQMKPGEYSSDTSPEEGIDAEVENKHDDDSPKSKKSQIHFYTIELGTADKINVELNSLGCSYSSIHSATNNFSCDNFLGEGGFGVVYKGMLDDGQLVAVKMQTEMNAKNIAEFHSEVHSLSFTRHTNIVTLLGYCCKDNLRILVYEYMNNRSLEWHLFDDTEGALDWNQRRDIAIGTATGLKFLHEESRGHPIIHRDVRPSKIFLTHEFVPLLGDSGLAKWKTRKFDKQRKIHGNLGYLAPECAENGFCSAKTDVYAFGILLIQLISGRRAVDTTRDDHQQPIRQWALSLIETHALHDLVDPRIGDTFCSYDLYSMARAAYYCLQTKPTLRPTMGEVLRLLMGKNDHLRHVKSNLYPVITTDANLS